MQYMIVLVGMLVLVSAILAALGFKGRPQVVGIDLGTTFSVVAMKATDGVISIIPDHVTGKKLLPSVVSILENGTVVVGDRAVELRGLLPERTIFNAKRFIGRTLGEVASEQATHPYRVSANFTSSSDDSNATNSSGPAGFAIALEGSRERWFSPTDIGAAVVSHMRESIQKHLGFGIRQVVICVPAKFGYRESKATSEAFQAAGFKVARVLEEPTAAAVAYNLHRGAGIRYVLVYDIGGGTLDTSLLYMNGRSVSVLGVAGDDHLGGSDFDVQMRTLLASKVESALQAEDAQAKESCDSTGLYILAEEVKIRLSSEQSVEIRCRHEDGKDRILVTSREGFEDAAAELFGRAMAPVDKVLSDQMMTPDDVSDIVLVGGASRTPKLRKMLQEYFGPQKSLHTDIDPDITVAWGAASILD